MKRKITYCLLGLIALFGINKYLIQDNKNEEIKTIKLAEVTHSAFYAPLYVALEQGYFKENNLNIDLILTSGADKVAASVLSNSVDIGFAGVESAIYVYNGGEEDYLVTFSGLTKRDGQFIVSRENISNFSLNDLKGKEVLGGRLGGMPLLNFQNALIKNNISLDSVNINTSIDFASLTGAFISGIGDFVNLFEPNATKLVSEGYGYIVGNIGYSGYEVPYTAFYTRKSYLENNKDILIKFTKSINKGLEFVNNHSSEEIAKIILPRFPDISLKNLTIIIENYKKYDSWLSNPYISENSFKNLVEMIKNAKLISNDVPYNELINNLYNE